MGNKAHNGGGRDDRPRIHIRQTMDGRVAWRKGPGGIDRPARTAGEALDDALATLGHGPAVIFWEGATE